MTKEEMFKTGMGSVFAKQEEKTLDSLKILSAGLILAFLSSSEVLRMIGGIALPLVAYLLTYYYLHFPRKQKREGFVLRLWVISILLEAGAIIAGNEIVQLNMVFIPALVFTALLYIDGKEKESAYDGEERRELSFTKGLFAVVLSILSVVIKGGMGGVLFVWFVGSFFKKSNIKGNVGKLIIQTVLLYVAYLSIWGDSSKAGIATLVGSLYIPIIYIAHKHESKKKLLQVKVK